MPRNDIHRCASLVDCPAISTQTKVVTDIISNMGVAILKYLHLMFSVTTMKNIPTPRIRICLMIGAM